MSAHNGARRKSRGLPKFYIVYFILLALAIAVLTVVLKTETDLLAEYESVQPKYAAEDAFRKYFSPPDYQSLLRDASYSAEGLTDEELTEYLSEQIGGEELTFASAASDDGAAMRYIVRAGSKQVAAIDITKSERTTEHGFATYEFSGIELFIVVGKAPEPEVPVITYTVTVNAPSGYEVTVDGSALTEPASTEHRADAMQYYPSTADGVDYDIYVLPELLAIPESVKVTSPDGEAEVTFDEETLTYTAGIVYSEELRAEFSDFVIDTLEGFASYTHSVPGSAFSNIKSSFDRSSQLYKDIRAVESNLWMEFEPDSDSFEDVYAGEFYMFPDGVISCHASLTQVLSRRGKERSEVLDMYVFMHQVDGEYKIFEWHQV